MGDTLTGVLRQCAAALLDERDSVVPDDVVECAYRRHPGVMALETERLVRNAACRVVKEIMRELASDEEDNDQQQALPGLGLPTAICNPNPEGEGFIYVRYDKASLEQLEAGELIREQHVEAAVAALDRYRASVARLRPYFDEEHITVREAYSAWRTEAGAA